MIRYTDSIQRFNNGQFSDFCVGWGKPLSSEKLYGILENAHTAIVAYDTEHFQPVGFIYAISDGILSAYIPLLEVLPDYQHQGIGKKLMEIIADRLQNFYMLDLCCDEKLEAFYHPLGFAKVAGMIKRNYESL